MRRPAHSLFFSLCLLLFLSFLVPVASAQYVVGGPTINFGSTMAGSSWSRSVTFAGSCNGQYWNSGSSGNVPPGVSAIGTTSGNTAVFSGTPTTPGTYTWTNYVYVPGYACGFTTYNYNVVLTVLQPVTITTASIPGATEGAGYSTTLSATGGTPGYTWSLALGSPPPGVSLNPAGTIVGTPTSAGTFGFTAKVTDAASGTATQALSLTVTSNLSIATASLPGGIAGAGYSTSLTASGGNPGYSWSVISGSFPPGLSLAASGAISGAPSTAGTYSFTVQATDTGPGVATKAVSITVGPAISITTTSLPSGLTGSPYSASISVTGGSGSYTGWGIWAGGNPPGITNGSTAANPLILSGTPTTAGTYTVTWANCDAVTSQCASQPL